MTNALYKTNIQNLNLSFLVFAIYCDAKVVQGVTFLTCKLFGVLTQFTPTSLLQGNQLTDLH